MKNKKCFFYLSAFALAVLCSACSSVKPEKKIIGDFSEAVRLTADNVASSFEIVEESHRKVQALKTVVYYDSKGFNPDAFEPFFSEESLNFRLELLKALKVYAEKIVGIMDDKYPDRLDQQTALFGESLAKLNREFVESGFLPVHCAQAGTREAPADLSQVQILTAAVNALGRWFIEYKREKKVGEITAEMQKPIGEICKFLIEDVGYSPGGKGEKMASGLRGQLWNQFDEAMMLQDKFIRDNSAGFDPLSKKKEIIELISLAGEQMKYDVCFEQLQKSIGDIRKTHDRLAEAFDPSTDGPSDLECFAEQLVGEAKRINEFYKSLKAENEK